MKLLVCRVQYSVIVKVNESIYSLYIAFFLFSNGSQFFKNVWVAGIRPTLQSMTAIAFSLLGLPFFRHLLLNYHVATVTATGPNIDVYSNGVGSVGLEP